MKTIQVASLPLKAVIEDISKAFNTTPEISHGEHLIRLPDNIGEGSLRGINFDGGLGILQYECTFYDDTEIQFIVDKVHPLKFLYVIKGKLHHRFENEEKGHIVYQFQNAIVASSDNHGHILNFKKNVHTCIFSLEINREIFSEKSTFKRDGMDPRLKRLFKDVEAEISFFKVTNKRELVSIPIIFHLPYRVKPKLCKLYVPIPFRLKTLYKIWRCKWIYPLPKTVTSFA